MDPLVSILIPAYNSDQWLAEAIDSAMAQTWHKKEIIIVDDGSTDNTLSVAQRFSSPILKVVTQPNQGASAARNKALSIAQGDYIQWLDADDLLDPMKISSQLRAVDVCSDNLVLFSGAWGRFSYRGQKARFKPSSLWQDLQPLDWLIEKMSENTWMQTTCWLVSQKLSQMAGPWDLRLLSDDDGEYFCRVIRCSTSVKFVSEARSFYRTLIPNSLSYRANSSDRYVKAHFLSICLHIKYLLSMEDSERTRAVCRKFLQNNYIHFYPERKVEMEKISKMAADFGGQISTPQLSWKYKCIRLVFGWKTVKLVQQIVRRWRSVFARTQGRMIAALIAHCESR